jgi:serine/threonine protein kinase
MRKSGLVEETRFQACLEHSSSSAITAGEMAERLKQEGLLTAFQAELLMSGKSRGFFLGGYCLLSPLGSGKGGVYLCHHTVENRRVAVKIVPSARMKDPAMRERFFRATRTADLNHPNIVQCHAIEEYDKIYLVVMEYIDGENLQRLVDQKGPLAVAKAADCVRQAALALQHLHDKGRVHGDVKPANLLMDRSGRVKILALGLARLRARKRKETETKSAGCQVPEQAADNRQGDVRADIYSLGATLHYLLTGQVPPREPAAKTRRGVRVQRGTKLLRLRPDVPAALAAVLDRMLAKEPAKRFQTAGEVATALEPFCTQLDAQLSAEHPEEQGGSSSNAPPKRNKTKDLPPADAVRTASAVSPSRLLEESQKPLDKLAVRSALPELARESKGWPVWLKGVLLGLTALVLFAPGGVLLWIVLRSALHTPPPLSAPEQPTSAEAQKKEVIDFPRPEERGPKKIPRMARMLWGHNEIERIAICPDGTFSRKV